MGPQEVYRKAGGKMIFWIYGAFVLLLLVVINIGGTVAAIRLIKNFMKGEADGDTALLVLLILAFDMLVVFGFLRRN